MLIEKLSIAIVLILSYVFQVNADFIALAEIKPDLLLILTIYIAFYKGEFSGLWLGFFTGLLQDINLGGYVSLTSGEVTKYFIGSHALPKALIGYFTGKLLPLFLSENPFVISLLIFSGNLIKGILFLSIIMIFHEGYQISAAIFIILPESLYTAIVGMFWFRLLKKILPMKNSSQDT